MANLNNSFIYKKFKTTLIQNFGKEKAFQIWNEANTKLKKLTKLHKKSGSDEKISPVIKGMIIELKKVC